MHLSLSEMGNRGLYSWGLLAVLIASAPVCFASEEIEKESPLFGNLAAFNALANDLVQLSQHEKIPFSLKPISQPARLTSKPQFPLQAKKEGKLDEGLPALSTDPSKINPVDIQAFGLIPNSNAVGSTTGGLPLPQARVVSPVGEQSSREMTEAPRSTLESINNPEVLTGLTPRTTRFGKDPYDKNLFLSQPMPRSSTGSTEPGSMSGDNKQALSINGGPSESSSDADPDKKKEQDARETFQKTMKEFAERTEDKEAFRLVDYYDLKNLIAKHESILPSFENDEIDERFVQNARIIFDRFGDKDGSFDKRPFERFLRRMEPEQIIFRSQDLRQNTFPSAARGQNHRERSSD